MVGLAWDRHGSRTPQIRRARWGSHRRAPHRAPRRDRRAHRGGAGRAAPHRAVFHPAGACRPARRPGGWRRRAGPEPLEGARHLLARRRHRAARRVDRQRRTAVDLERPARRLARGRAVDPVRLRPGVRSAARPRRSSRRRLGPAADVRHRRRAVHGRERALRVRPERARPGDRPPRAGLRGRPAHTAGDRAHPAAVPRQGARHRLRAVRCHRRHRDRDRPPHRRAAHHRVRHRERLALRLLREPARGTRHDPPGLPLPARRGEEGTRSPARLRPGRHRAARCRGGRPAAAVRAVGAVEEQREVVAGRRRRRVRRPVRAVGAPLRPDEGAGHRPRALPPSVVLARRRPGHGVLRRLHPAVLRPDARTAVRPALLGPARRPGLGALRDRFRRRLDDRWTGRAPLRPAAHRRRHGPGPHRARRCRVGGREPLRTEPRLVAGAAAPGRGHRLRAHDLAEPDAHALRGPGGAGRLGRRSHPGRRPRRVGDRHRGGRQRLLLGAREHEGRLRAGAAAGARSVPGVRRGRARGGHRRRRGRQGPAHGGDRLIPATGCGAPDERRPAGAPVACPDALPPPPTDARARAGRPRRLRGRRRSTGRAGRVAARTRVPVGALRRLRVRRDAQPVRRGAGRPRGGLGLGGARRGARPGVRGRRPGAPPSFLTAGRPRRPGGGREALHRPGTAPPVRRVAPSVRPAGRTAGARHPAG
ncbi:hypothetical protein Cus16_2526 [Curtobacterium sp. ER1/6]|nr:hypothetical protein Cus16_2526 [Curtobacterium sp. ER1/6]